jgi:DNA mismatch endonuclease (patch repair protein)
VADIFTRAERSRIMAAVKSKGNKLTEARLVRLFREYRITGWRRHLPLPGSPDFTFRQKRVVIFVDGCFWHGCAKHLRMPLSNKLYWEKKISRNMIRDRIAAKQLREKGWKVIRVWEHELGHESRVLKRILKALTSP